MAPSDPDLTAVMTNLAPTISKLCRIAGVPGMSIGVAFKDRLYHANYGFQDIKASKTPNSDTIYAIGGMAKPIIASAIGILVYERKLAYTTRVAEILPEFKFSSFHTPKEKITEQLTVADLLCHRAGLTGSNHWWYGAGGALLLHKEQTLDFYTKFEPSGTFRLSRQYSDWGYAVLGEIIEKITGNSCGAYVESKIFKPLGMDRSSSQWRDPLKVDNMAKPYGVLDDKTQFPLPQPQVCDESIMFAARGMSSTINDLLKYSLALLEALGPLLHSSQVRYREDSLQPVLKNVPIQLAGHISLANSVWEKSGAFGFIRSQLPNTVEGMGCNDQWVLEEFPTIIPETPSAPVIATGGSLPGYTSSLALLPLHKCSIVVSTNATGLGDASEWVVLAVIEALLKTRAPSDFIRLANLTAFRQVAYFSVMAEGFYKENDGIHPPRRLLRQYVGTYEKDGWKIEIRLAPDDSLQVAFQGHSGQVWPQVWPMKHIKVETFTWLPTRNDLVKRACMVRASSGEEFRLIFLRDVYGKVDRLCWPHTPGLPFEKQYFYKCTSR